MFPQTFDCPAASPITILDHIEVDVGMNGESDAESRAADIVRRIMVEDLERAFGPLPWLRRPNDAQPDIVVQDS